MDMPSFLRFDPVPLKVRHDGWTPELQQRFVLLLARGAGPDSAARRLGKTRQTAYALRKKAGAESFAAAWDAALRYAKRARAATWSAAAPASPATPQPRLGPPAAAAALTPERAAFNAMLDRLYPQGEVDRDEAGETDKADRK